MWPRIRHMFLWKNIPSSADSRRASCQLLAKEWTLYTGKLPLGGLPRNNVVLKVTDHPDMTEIFPLPLIQKEQVVSYWQKKTGKLPLGGLSRNNVILKVTDHPDMTSAVYCGPNKAVQQKALLLGIVRIKINNNRSTSLERSVINGGGGLHRYNQHDHQFLQWLKTF